VARLGSPLAIGLEKIKAFPQMLGVTSIYTANK